ncbi:MAG TPA: alpha/beta fold hydrolase [Flavisolibacter sp.]|nr:alpha/beta fold hydrolase [Flavisolibacter sp.]
MKFNHIRYGSGQPLLLIHGIGGSWRSWIPVLDRLSAHRELIVIDLPGHGKTPPLEGPTTIYTLADAVTEFLERNDLKGIDVVGSSMGGRLVLELARRGGVVGAVVSLDPGGFWDGWERPFFHRTGALSVRLLRALKFGLPALTDNVLTRSLLLAQLSVKPWDVTPRMALTELKSIATTPVYDELLHDLAYGQEQEGADRGSIAKPFMIGWGRQDRVCFPSQAKKALHFFPDAHVYWFNRCGHFPHWDKPAETIALILRVTTVAVPEKASEEHLT